MVNFLRKNGRLPNDIKELNKQISYSKGCGCRFIFNKFSEELMRLIYTITSINVFYTITNKYENISLQAVIIFLIVLLILFIPFKPLINIITNICSYVYQKRFLPKDPTDEALNLAYECAKEWNKYEKEKKSIIQIIIKLT